MAISKWISFAVPAQQQPSPAVDSLKPAQQFSTLSRADAKQFGLENFGNTCYANSVLQALYFCAPFRDLVIQSADSSSPSNHSSSSQQALSLPSERINGNGSATHSHRPTSLGLTIPSSPPTLFSALRSLFVFISNNPQDKGTIPPRAFIDKLKEVNEHFRSTMHQDAHEFLNYLLNKIVEEVGADEHHRDRDTEGEDLSASVATLSSGPGTTVRSGSSTDDTTIVHRLFEGTLTSETRCLTCETVSSRDESFLDLSIDIEENSSVTACLRQFSASEMLCQKNKFFCDSCCGLQEAEKRMKIKKLPNVLALHLKRFKYQEDVQKYIKLAYRVAFPLELRLFNTVDDAPDPDRLYELFSIVVHIGNGPHHGHYIAIVKGPTSWLLFDDDKIGPIKESDIPRYFGDSPSGSAYVLYYQAVDLDPTSLGIKPDSPLPTSSTVPSTAGDSTPYPPAVPAGSSFLSGTTLTSHALAQAQAQAQQDEAGPAVPPGLGGDESRSVAESETTSSSATAPPTPAASAAIRPKISIPTLSINTPTSSPTVDRRSQQHTSPASPNGRPGSGLLHGLRVSPSPFGRSSGDIKSLGKKSMLESSTLLKRPSTAPSAPDAITAASASAGGKTVSPPVPAVPPKPQVNGKDEKEKEKEQKELDRRPSTSWFKRMSKVESKDKEKEKIRSHHHHHNHHKELESTTSPASPASSHGTSRSDPLNSWFTNSQDHLQRNNKLKSSGTVSRRSSAAHSTGATRRTASVSVSSSAPMVPSLAPPIPAHATTSRATGSSAASGVSSSPPASTFDAVASSTTSSSLASSSSKSAPSSHSHLSSSLPTTFPPKPRPLPSVPDISFPPPPISSSSPSATHLSPEHKRSVPSLSTSVRRREHEQEHEHEHDSSPPPPPSPSTSSAPRSPRTPTTPTRPFTAGATTTSSRSPHSTRPSIPLPISPIVSEPGNLSVLQRQQRGRMGTKFSDGHESSSKERDESRSRSQGMWRRPRSAHGHSLGLPFMRRSNPSLDRQVTGTGTGRGTGTGTDGSRSRPSSPNPPLASVPASAPLPLKGTETTTRRGMEGSRPGSGVSTKDGSVVHFGGGVSSSRGERAREDGSSGSGGGSSSGKSLKRAARKLSFSTSFMGLGKKDREKSEKETKDRRRPPTSYTSPTLPAGLL